jgi:hypothetical protein
LRFALIIHVGNLIVLIAHHPTPKEKERIDFLKLFIPKGKREVLTEKVV